MFSNDTAEQAAAQRNAGLQAGYGELSNNYGLGRDTLQTGYSTAGNLYAGLGNTYSSLYGGGASAYGDATGANGSAGFDRAQSNFRSDPGYGFQMDQGLQALQRTHAAAGNLASGNADADTLKFSQGLADQSYGNYVSRLAPYLQLAGSGAQVATAGQAAAATGAGTSLNANLMAQGNAGNANFTGQGASDAAATMNNYNVGANQLSALVAGGKLAAGLFGGFGGGAGGGSGTAFVPSASFMDHGFGFG